MHRLPTPHAGPLLIHTPRSHPADHDSDGTTGHRLRAPIAASLSLLLPGAGQLYNRQHLLAALFVLPIVYVHCEGGLGRSPTIAMALLMQRGFSRAEAHRLVLGARSVAAPTDEQDGWLAQVEREVGPDAGMQP